MRSAGDVWVQIQAICRDAMATGRTIATINKGVANRILEVRPNAIVRASAEARTPDGQGALVTRSMIERVWHPLASGGHASGSGEDRFTYALVAEIPGVVVDNDRGGLRIADWDLAMTPYQEEGGVGATPPRRRYWTLAANPARYRVVDAVRNLDEDWWTTGDADLHAGDRVAIWKYKGSGDHRGIIAFGEVLTDPEIHDDDPTYWIDSEGTAPGLRVRVRYVIKPSEPLWLESAPPGSVVLQLPVSRAQGGTAHHVTADQWKELMAFVGGWPRPDAGEDDEASDMPTFRAWSFKTLSKTANGVLHYPDEPTEYYAYDNKVKNSRHVRVGDLAVIQDSDYVFGAGWIDGIEVSAQEKIRYRCPSCKETDIKKRDTKQPVYWCSGCHTAFDVPEEEHLDVVTYTANYSRTFELADRFFPVSVLEPAFVARSKQNAIRELDVSLLRPLLEENLGTGAPWWDAQIVEDEKIVGGHKLGMRKNRIGQQRFREALLARHGEACAFTGSQPAAALEAAHLVPYSKLAEHDVKAGLLLRRDLHVLFDRHLITIDPATWSIRVAPKLMPYPDLAILEGRPVLIREELRPALRLIEEHASAAGASWE